MSNSSLSGRSENTLRAPEGAGEPIRAVALRSLTYALPPAGQEKLRQLHIAIRQIVLYCRGVSVYFLGWNGP
ncbi:hypothetical protein CUC15_12095 [Oceanobacillus zhaokaii]|uniref:Uncharacterized protein n=1 Tax=Oceanobacillus zhaokaii TaxID=2052660 RepID=A0A345PHY8_9BACI|nr:hypothetical protein CUC15_12095 [Oceanobacillus zhaokaii]